MTDLLMQGTPGAEQEIRRDPAFGLVPISPLRSLFGRLFAKINALAIAYEVNGIDVSKWNGPMDWQIAASRRLRFGYFRGGFGTNTKDAQVDNNRANCKLDAWGLYWFFYAGSTDPIAAADGFYAVWKEGPGDLYPLGDFEYTTLDKIGTANWIYKCANRFQDRSGVEEPFYTSPGWWNAHVAVNTWAKDHKLVVAHWTTLASPTLPYDWSRYAKLWWMWQHSANGNNLGVYYGAPAPPAADADMDLDRYYGTLAQFQAEFGVASLTLDQRVKRLEDAALTHGWVL